MKVSVQQDCAVTKVSQTGEGQQFWVTPYTHDNTKGMGIMGCRVEPVVTIATASEVPAERDIFCRYPEAPETPRQRHVNTHAGEKGTHGKECAREGRAWKEHARGWTTETPAHRKNKSRIK